MKEGGSEHLQNTIPTPEHSIRASSPVLSNRRHGGDYLSGQANYRQPMEDVGNIEVFLLRMTFKLQIKNVPFY